MIYFLKNYFFVSLFIVLFLPFSVFANEVRLEINKVDIKTNEQFLVDIVVQSADPLNAIKGKIIFSSDFFDIKEIRDGGSSVNFWIEKPKISSDGSILFSGITPGGFVGVNNLIFSMLFETKKSGAAIIKIEDVEVFLNDGLGTQKRLGSQERSFFIENGDSKIRKEVFEDREPPENFTPLITKHADIYDNKNILLFATQDKGSGISHFEIKEYKIPYLHFLSLFKDVESPYVLSDQSLKSHIIIKAVDNSGNERVIKLNATHRAYIFEYMIYLIIISFIFAGAFVIFKICKKHFF